jgi:hypothetical protein
VRGDWLALPAHVRVGGTTLVYLLGTTSGRQNPAGALPFAVTVELASLMWPVGQSKRPVTSAASCLPPDASQLRQDGAPDASQLRQDGAPVAPQLRQDLALDAAQLRQDAAPAVWPKDAVDSELRPSAARSRSA